MYCSYVDNRYVLQPHHGHSPPADSGQPSSVPVSPCHQSRTGCVGTAAALVVVRGPAQSTAAM